MGSWQSFMSLHLKPLDIDHPLMLSFEESKLRQIEAHALIYLSQEHLRLEFREKVSDNLVSFIVYRLSIVWVLAHSICEVPRQEFARDLYIGVAVNHVVAFWQ